MIRRPGQPPRPPCALCGRIRLFVIAAALILVGMWSQPDWRLPAEWDLSAYVGDLFLLAFIALFGWKYYQYRKAPPPEDEPPPPVRLSRSPRRNRSPGDPRF